MREIAPTVLFVKFCTKYIITWFLMNVCNTRHTPTIWAQYVIVLFELIKVTLKYEYSLEKATSTHAIITRHPMRLASIYFVEKVSLIIHSIGQTSSSSFWNAKFSSQITESKLASRRLLPYSEHPFSPNIGFLKRCWFSNYTFFSFAWCISWM